MNQYVLIALVTLLVIGGAVLLIMGLCFHGHG
jgi:hypothetical protein